VKFHEIPASSVGKPSVEMLKGMKVAELTEMMSNLGFRAPSSNVRKDVYMMRS